MIAIWASVSTNRRKWLTTEFNSVDHLKGFLFFMTWKIALEIFGYFGTALVIISMLMTGFKSIISVIYALFVSAMPAAVATECGR